MDIRFVLWRLFSRHGRLIAVALILSGIGFGVVAVDTYTTSVVQQETITTDRATFQTELGTRATVVRSSPLYREGETLEDRSLYVLDAAPDLTLVVEANVPDDRRVTVGHKLVLTINGEANDEVFWTSRRTLVERESVVRSGTVETRTTINVSELGDRIERLKRASSGFAWFEPELKLETTYETRRYEGTLESAAQLRVTSEAYWVDGTVKSSTTEQDTRVRTVRRDPTRVEYGPPAVAGALLVLSGLAVGIARRRGWYQDLYTETDITRQRFDDWISAGEFPTASNRRYVQINDLEGLVDVAIDSDKRAIYDDSFEGYAVVDGDIVYYYSPHDRLDSWLDI